MSAAADTDGSGFESQGAHYQSHKARVCCPQNDRSETGAQQASGGVPRIPDSEASVNKRCTSTASLPCGH